MHRIARLRRMIGFSLAVGLCVLLGGRAEAWEEGRFRVLPANSGDLVTFVHGLNHPTTGYVVPSATRLTNFNAFLDAVFAATNASLANPETGDWCLVISRAATAGYTVQRYYDTVTDRWFLYAFDNTGQGQASLFINPEARRNLVIEVPHSQTFTGSASEDYTGREGIRLFVDLSARALILNGATRCASGTDTSCDGSQSQCTSTSSPPRRSDVAHETETLFFAAHQRFEDLFDSRFVQLHGKGSGTARAIIGDGTINDTFANSVAITYASNLSARLAATDRRVDACQASGDPEEALCGKTNVEGRYTNRPAGNACTTGTSTYVGRFLHIEQERDLGDTLWDSVSEAVRDTWYPAAACDMNNASTCLLGSSRRAAALIERPPGPRSARHPKNPLRNRRRIRLRSRPIEPFEGNSCSRSSPSRTSARRTPRVSRRSNPSTWRSGAGRSSRCWAPTELGRPR